MISIVIPLYNKAQSITRTLDSVISQTFTDYEVVVVNDGSTDGSGEVVEQYAANHPQTRFRLIHKENGGVSSARNAGIRQAKGEFIAFLDADDIWSPDYLLEQKKMINDFPQCALWGINFAEVTDGNKLVRKLATGLPEGYRGYIEDYFGLIKKGRISDLYCSSSVVVRKDVFNCVGYFDQRIKYSEDVDMWWRIILNYRVAFYDKYFSFYNFEAPNRAMNKKRLLKYWLPYYSDKFNDYKGVEPFYTWFQRWCAVNIKLVFFNDGTQFSDAKAASKKLDYSVLPIKYRIYFKLPIFISKIAYKIKH